MARITPLHPDDAPEEARVILEDFFKVRGNVPNMFRTLARRPATLKTATEHLKALFAEATLPAKILELVAVRVSVLNECRY